MHGSSSLSGCNSTDFMYPLLADIYYPIITQDEYGKAVKEWVFDTTVACNAQALRKKAEEEMSPAVFLQSDGKLLARTRCDIRVSGNNQDNAITNILITNVRLPGGEIVYRETAGPRKGRGTIFEVATLEPFVGGLQKIEYYFMMWRRSENQTVGD